MTDQTADKTALIYSFATVPTPTDVSFEQRPDPYQRRYIMGSYAAVIVSRRNTAMAHAIASSLPNDRPAGWSRLQIVLHWLVVGLIALQYIDSGSMEALFDATFEGDAVSTVDTFLGWSHIIAGSAILAAMIVRLINRFAKGRPPLDASEPDWTRMLARITHVLLYATLLAMPALGLLAWFTGDERFADLHTFLWTPLLVLIALHVTGALAQHFWFRSGALRRMTTLRKS